jgi:hypothetical protein
MSEGKQSRLSAAQRTDVWRRWKAGESLHEIGRACGKRITVFAVCCCLAEGLLQPLAGALVERSAWQNERTFLISHRTAF